MARRDLKRIQQLFEEALSLPEEDRASFLEDVCDDARLRARVESLLKHNEAANSHFMRTPDEERGGDVDADRWIGKCVGGCQIEEVIAAGGMGTVYLAKQENPKRDVAVKMMHAGLMSRESLRRFEYESQILARLHHPNIAQVYAAGAAEDHLGLAADGDRLSTHSTPYFVMEYVPGARTLTQYASEKELAISQRLALFVEVCEAVQHGHRMGVIHRDLKPGNILVDASGHVKVIDFGVARSTDADMAITTLNTQPGQLMGTLQYMSPEQCGASLEDLDTRSDVYSLGVVLYELLWERPPYNVSGAGIGTAVRMVCEMPPTPPGEITGRGTRFPKPSRDVEMIVTKALQKKREDRYQSASEFADDIKRHLNGEPTEARPPTWWTRGLRWAARKPMVASTVFSLAIAATIIGASALAIWYANGAPFAVELVKDTKFFHDPSGRSASLLSISGRVLHEWRTETQCAVKFASMIDEPDELGGRKLAIIAFDNTPSNPHPGLVCAFDVNGDLDKPIWTCRIEEDEPVPDPYDRKFRPENFEPTFCDVYDIFPEYPGCELIVVFSHEKYSQRIVRIYSLQGETLYQVWQDGGCRSCQWLSGPRLLVFAGVDATVYWQDGHLKQPKHDPRVLFAIRPALGCKSHAYIRGHKDPDHPSLVWYKYLYFAGRPLHAECGWRHKLIKVNGVFDARTHFELAVLHHSHDGPPDYAVSFVIDQNGDPLIPINSSDYRDMGGVTITNEYERLLKLYDEGDPRRPPEPNTLVLTSEPPPDRVRYDIASGQEDVGG